MGRERVCTAWGVCTGLEGGVPVLVRGWGCLYWRGSVLVVREEICTEGHVCSGQRGLSWRGGLYWWGERGSILLGRDKVAVWPKRF